MNSTMVLSTRFEQSWEQVIQKRPGPDASVLVDDAAYTHRSQGEGLGRCGTDCGEILTHGQVFLCHETGGRQGSEQEIRHHVPRYGQPECWSPGVACLLI